MKKQELINQLDKLHHELSIKDYRIDALNEAHEMSIYVMRERRDEYADTIRNLRSQHENDLIKMAALTATVHVLRKTLNDNAIKVFSITALTLDE